MGREFHSTRVWCLGGCFHRIAIRFFYIRMMWAGVEPQPQQYNTTYLNVMKQIMELLHSYDIVVLLDMHQDLLSSRTGSYDGIPAWLYDRFPPPKHACKITRL